MADPLSSKNSDASKCRGGLIIEKSRCCGAPLRYTTGFIVEICTKCDNPNPPPTLYK